MKSIKIISIVLGLMMSAQSFGFSALPSPNDYQNDPEGYFHACTDNNTNDEASCEQATNQYFPEGQETIESSASSTDTVASTDLVSQNDEYAQE